MTWTDITRADGSRGVVELPVADELSTAADQAQATQTQAQVEIANALWQLVKLQQEAALQQLMSHTPAPAARSSLGLELDYIDKRLQEVEKTVDGLEADYHSAIDRLVTHVEGKLDRIVELEKRVGGHDLYIKTLDGRREEIERRLDGHGNRLEHAEQDIHDLKL